MEHDYSAEINQLKEEITQIKKMVIRGQIPRKRKITGTEVLDKQGYEALDQVEQQLIAFTDISGASGALAYAGTFIGGDLEAQSQSMWSSSLPTEELMHLNDNHLVEKVLSSVGNSQRMAILLELLKKPRTAIQLIEVLGFNSTGQIYHHLKPLLSADIIQEAKGVYAVIPYRVQGIIMLLAGVHDLIDSQFSTGTWEDASITSE